MAEAPITFNPAAIWERIDAFAQFGKHGETGVARPVYSPAWQAAQAEIIAWAQRLGLDVRTDAVGNVWAKLEGSEGGKSIVTGSHFDSQLPGGRFDGILGVIAGIAALGALKEHFGTPKRTLEAVALCEEESSRFPTAGFWGSRAITGRIHPGDTETVISFDGEKIGDVMSSIGLDPARTDEAVRNDIEAFIELHIEQGPLLESEGLPLGVVTAITGIRHYQITVTGVSNHAGAFPMDLRKDPMAAAAEMISNVINRATERGRPAVTTVGRIAVDPNFPAIVPERVTFVIDARHPDPEARLQLYADHEAAIREIAARRGVQVEIVDSKGHDPYLCDPGLIAAFERAAQAIGSPYMKLASGAAHDTQQMGSIAKGVMIFVRSKDGRSHTPAEYTSPEDVAIGIAALTEGLRTLAYE